MNKNMGVTIVYVVFMLISIVSLGLLFYLSTRMIMIKNTMLKTEGTINSIVYFGENTPTVIISYVYDDIVYTAQSTIYSSSMREGDLITIYIDPTQPHIYYQPNIVTHTIMPLIFALTFGGIGFSGFIVGILHRKKKIQLMNSGKKIVAVITEFKLNMNYVMTTGRQRQYRSHIFCKVINEFTEEEIIYKSHGFWSSTNRDVTLGVSTIDIWIDPENPKRYMMDLHSIKL